MLPFGSAGIVNIGKPIISGSAGAVLYVDASGKLANLADVAAGSFLRSGGIGSIPVWSTTTLPNSATTGDLLAATAANTYGNIVDVAAGSFLRSGGVGVIPAWSTATIPTTVASGSILAANALDTLSAVTSTSGLKELQNNAGVIAWNATTGTGNSVCATTPTFVTNITNPLMIGGTGGTSTVIIRSTSGTGAAGADIIFQTGTNGGTEAARILNSGYLGIGDTNPSCLIRAAQATTFGTYTSHQTTAATADVLAAIFSTVTAQTPNLFAYGLVVELKQAITSGTPIEITAALNGLLAIPSTDSVAYNAASLGMAGFYIAEYGGTGSYPTLCGVFSRVQTSNSGTLTNAKAGYFVYNHITTSNGLVTNVYGVHIDRPVSVASHTMTNTFGLVIEQQNAALGTQTNTPFAIKQLGTADLISWAAKFTTYNNVSTTGWGVPAIYASGRSTAQTGDVASVAAYTMGGSDGSVLVSCNALVTAYTAGTQSVQVAYTDEGNTARTLTLTTSGLTGTLGATIGATGPFEGVVMRLRCKASTSITVKTVGTAWTGTYNVEADITQVA